MRITQARKHAKRDPLWLWNPGQTSPEVQNRGISGPTKRTCALQFFFKKFKTREILTWSECGHPYLHGTTSPKLRREKILRDVWKSYPHELNILNTLFLCRNVYKSHTNHNFIIHILAICFYLDFFFIKSQFCRLEDISELVPEDKVHCMSKFVAFFSFSNKYEYFQQSKNVYYLLPSVTARANTHWTKATAKLASLRKSTCTARFFTTFETLSANFKTSEFFILNLMLADLPTCVK